MEIFNPDDITNQLDFTKPIEEQLVDTDSITNQLDFTGSIESQLG